MKALKAANPPVRTELAYFSIGNKSEFVKNEYAQYK
jgi:hypothetical protein